MCKIFAMTNMDKVTINEKFLKTVQRAVCRTDNSGFGYATLTQHGQLWGERTINPSSFQMRINKPDTVTEKLPIISKQCDKFGSHTEKGNIAFIGHGRLSTNSVSLPNTHPFVGDGVALIHNGVVQDGGDKKVDCVTDNDTEILFRYWLRGGMPEVEANVTGYYALAILDKHGKMHIVRDDRASLYISYCRTVHSYIIATKPDIITEVAKKMKWTVDQPEAITPNTYTVFKGNNILSHTDIKPRGFEASYYGAWEDKAAIAFGDVNSDDRDTLKALPKDAVKIYDADGNRVYAAEAEYSNEHGKDFRAMSRSEMEDLDELEELEEEMEDLADMFARNERRSG